MGNAKHLPETKQRKNTRLTGEKKPIATRVKHRPNWWPEWPDLLLLWERVLTATAERGMIYATGKAPANQLSFQDNHRLQWKHFTSHVIHLVCVFLHLTWSFLCVFALLLRYRWESRREGPMETETVVWQSTGSAVSNSTQLHSYWSPHEGLCGRVRSSEHKDMRKKLRGQFFLNTGSILVVLSSFSYFYTDQTQLHFSTEVTSNTRKWHQQSQWRNVFSQTAPSNINIPKSPMVEQ